MDTHPTRILLSGLPGRMCGEVARRLAELPDEFPLIETALVGPDVAADSVEAAGRSFAAIPPAAREDWIVGAAAIRPFLAVDYTLPSAVEQNVEFYCRHGIPFVMGTTGVDMQKVKARISESKVTAVVAPNMAMPIVMLQAAARWVAQNFPGALTGYRAGIRESHQAAKKDTSGTAKALVADFEALGLPIGIDDIEMVRDPARQKAMGVPAEHIDGHAYHTYTVESPDGTVTLALSHNILGRRVYADGTVWAIRFLRHRVSQGDHGACYNMQDVLRAMAELT